MKKLLKPIMLPTNQQGRKYGDLMKVVIEREGETLNHLFISRRDTFPIHNEYYQHQHLYLIDETAEIKEGNWYFANQGIRKCIRIDKGNYPYVHLNKSGEEISDFYTWKGILVASTDKSLNLPGIPQSALEYFVKMQGSVEYFEVEVNEFNVPGAGFTNHYLKLSPEGEIVVITPKMLSNIRLLNAMIYKQEVLQEIADKKLAETILIKPNYKTLGTKMGAKMKAVAKAIEEMQPVDIEFLTKHGEILLSVFNEKILIQSSDVIITYPKIVSIEGGELHNNKDGTFSVTPLKAVYEESKVKSTQSHCKKFINSFFEVANLCDECKSTKTCQCSVIQSLSTNQVEITKDEIEKVAESYADNVFNRNSQEFLSEKPMTESLAWDTASIHFKNGINWLIKNNYKNP